jgi:hypothetical protein
LTTKTVEEKDSAKPTSARAPHDSSPTSDGPTTASRPRNPRPTAVERTMCTLVVSQISRRSRVRASNLRPMAKSRRTTPSSAMRSSPDGDGAPRAPRANPAAR